MQELGCEKLATGHYARIATEQCSDGSTRHLLLEASDANKDQSYYLYGLDQSQLSKVLFPLGGIQKKDVFALAQHYDIPFDEQYKESQDLCFFPEKTPKAFLQRHLADALEPGPIVRSDGTVVGTHQGLPLYTIGQRRGLGIGGLTIPLEVVEKRLSSNEIVVDERGHSRAAGVELTDVRWVSWEPASDSDQPFECRIRSLSPRVSGSLQRIADGVQFCFSSPQPLPAPGQSLVLYKGQELVGGGVISRHWS